MRLKDINTCHSAEACGLALTRGTLIDSSHRGVRFPLLDERQQRGGVASRCLFFFFFPFLSFLGRRKENVRENHQAYDYILDSPSSLPVSLCSRRLSICQQTQAHTCFGSLGVDGRRVSWKVVCFPRRLDESTSLFSQKRGTDPVGDWSASRGSPRGR